MLLVLLLSAEDEQNASRSMMGRGGLLGSSILHFMTLVPSSWQVGSVAVVIGGTSSNTPPSSSPVLKVGMRRLCGLGVIASSAKSQCRPDYTATYL